MRTRPALLAAALLLAPPALAQQVTVGKAAGGSTVSLFYGGSYVSSFEPFPGFTGGARLASGDVDGDGYADTIVGAGPGAVPAVYVFSGFDGSPIRTFYAYDFAFSGGVFVAAADFDGDGKADIVTGADASGGPQVKVFSGANPEIVLGSFWAFDQLFTGGVRVAAGDVNGDGVPDIIVGAGPGGGPQVRVISGTDFATELMSFFAYDPSFTGGVYVGAGDIDGDGHADILTGPGAGGSPNVKVFSGATGALIRSFFAFSPPFAGGVTVAAGRIDGDALDDVVAGTATAAGRVTAFRSTDLGSLQDFFPFGAYTGGVFVAVPAPAPDAFVSGDATICAGYQATLTADLLGSAPWNIQWSDGVWQRHITASPVTRTVSPASTTTYTLSWVFDLHGTGQSSGSAQVTVTPDNPPVVTAPSGIAVDQAACCGAFGGVTSDKSAALAAFLAAGSATDDCDPAPARLPPQVRGADVSGSTCFESGTTTVTFRYEDAGSHTGTATATVLVRMYGDLNLDRVVDPSDMVILRAYFNFVVAPGTPPFDAPIQIADLTHDTIVDPSDMVILRAYFNFVLGCLAPA